MYGITPAVGNCWYEACSSLSELNNMPKLSAKELRIKVVNHIEKSPNFDNVSSMIFESNITKLEEFKSKHKKEGVFTDEDGILALATGYYLNVTLRIISRSNTSDLPYTEYNPNQKITFYIFLDDRSVGSEHFQAITMGSVMSNDEIVTAYKTKSNNEDIEIKVKQNREVKIDEDIRFATSKEASICEWDSQIEHEALQPIKNEDINEDIKFATSKEASICEWDSQIENEAIQPTKKDDLSTKNIIKIAHKQSKPVESRIKPITDKEINDNKVKKIVDKQLKPVDSNIKSTNSMNKSKNIEIKLNNVTKKQSKPVNPIKTNSKNKNEEINKYDRSKRLEKAKSMKIHFQISHNLKKNETKNEPNMMNTKNPVKNDEEINKSKRLEKVKELKLKLINKTSEKNIKDIENCLNSIEITPGIKEKLDVEYAFSNETFSQEWQHELNENNIKQNTAKVNDNVKIKNNKFNDKSQKKQNIIQVTKSIKRKNVDDTEHKNENKIRRPNTTVKKQINPATHNITKYFSKAPAQSNSNSAMNNPKSHITTAKINARASNSTSNLQISDKLKIFPGNTAKGSEKVPDLELNLTKRRISQLSQARIELPSSLN